LVNLATKLFVALTGAALVAAIGYASVVGDRAGADLFVALAGGFAVVAAVTILAAYDGETPTPADAPAPERRNAFTEADAPSSSGWPFVAALTFAGVALATASGASWIAIALAAGAIAAVGWVARVWQEHPSFSAKVRARVVERLLAPVAMPVFGTLGALFIAAMVSRVLLAVTPTASWVIALILAAALLAVLWVIATRPRLQSSALAGIAVVGVLSITLAGAIGAQAGERQFHPEKPEYPVASMEAKNLQFSLKTLEFPADTEVEIKFANLDKDVFHNVAFYTSTEADRAPLFNGHPLPGGLGRRSRINYMTRTPAAGTYAFICDFHPAMTGKLIITPAGAGATGEGASTH
jgi:plastocyanin